jgi:ubiquinone/menaquinone biosynthesis C-methylase UbiE
MTEPARSGALGRWEHSLSRNLDSLWILERRALARFLCGSREGLLLDVACRDGFKTASFVQRGFHVVGIDIDIESVRTAQALYGGPHCHFVIGSAEQLPFRTGAFRRTTCLHSLAMIESPLEALREMGRCLDAEGELIVTVVSELAPWRNLRKYTSATLEQSLRGTGYEVVDACSYVRAPLLQWIERLRLGLQASWYRMVKMPLYLLSWPFAVAERFRQDGGYVVGARARKTS